MSGYLVVIDEIIDRHRLMASADLRVAKEVGAYAVLSGVALAVGLALPLAWLIVMGGVLLVYNLVMAFAFLRSWLSWQASADFWQVKRDAAAARLSESGA